MSDIAETSDAPPTTAQEPPATQTPHDNPAVGVCIGPGREWTLGFLPAVLRTITDHGAIVLFWDRVERPEGIQWPDGTVHLSRSPDLPEPIDEYAAIAYGREQIRLWFLKGGRTATHLYWHDADTIPPVDVIPRLVQHGVPMVSGVYNMRLADAPIIPMMIGDDPAFGRETLRLLADPAGTCQVRASGMGSMLVRADALGVAPFKIDRDGSERFGEDYQWCLDAERVGFAPVLIDKSVTCWHARSLQVATRPRIGELMRGVVFAGPDASVRTQYGTFAYGTPRFDLSESVMDSLGYEFEVGEWPAITLERATVAEALLTL